MGSPVPDGFNAKCPSYSANVNDTKGEVWQAMPTDEHGEGSWFMATFGKPVTVGCIKVQVPPHYASECVGLKKACEPHTSTLSTCRPVTLSLALSLLAFTPPPPSSALTPLALARLALSFTHTALSLSIRPPPRMPPLLHLLHLLPLLPRSFIEQVRAKTITKAAVPPARPATATDSAPHAALRPRGPTSTMHRNQSMSRPSPRR